MSIVQLHGWVRQIFSPKKKTRGKPARDLGAILPPLGPNGRPQLLAVLHQKHSHKSRYLMYIQRILLKKKRDQKKKKKPPSLFPHAGFS